jgi:3-deoxy-D-manno-octulosonate 8-phosphate phosphatase (KDO 8-P phosphatase)
MKEPKLLVLDVDGVLTDGTKIYQSGKPMYKRFNDKDFTAIKLLKARGIHVCFLTADSSNRQLAADRQIDYFNSRDVDNRIIKKARLEEIKEFYMDADPTMTIQDMEDVWVVGDDIFDVEMFDGCISFCPADAPNYVRARAYKVLNSRGGEGVVVEIVDRFLRPATKEEISKMLELDSHEGWSRSSR